MIIFGDAIYNLYLCIGNNNANKQGGQSDLL